MKSAVLMLAMAALLAVAQSNFFLTFLRSCKMISKILLRRIVLLVCVGCLSSAALAADVNWTGGGTDSYWATGENWSTGLVPTAADNARLTVSGAAVEIPAGESYEVSTFHVAHYANNTLYVAPGATLTATSTGSRSFVAREGGQSVGVLTVDGTVNANQLQVTGGAGANATIIVNEGGLLTSPLLLFGTWGGGQHGTLIVNGGLVDVGQFGAYLSLCNVTIDLNDGVYDCGYLNPAVLGLYDNANGSLLVDIDYGKWIISGDRTTDVATMLGRGEIIGFGGQGTVEYDFDVTTPGKTTVYATHPLNQIPEWKDVILVPTEGGTTTLEWDNYVEPNAPGGTVTATVLLGTDLTDPNNYTKVIDAQVVTSGSHSSVTSTTLIPTQDYYWQVIFDNGTSIEGPVFKFLATDNAIPTVSIKDVYAWLDEATGKVDVLMDATVDNDPGETVTYSWTLSPVDDPNVVFDSTSTEDPTLTISKVADYTLTLSVNDGVWEDQSASARVSVSINACQAARQTPDYRGNLDGDLTDDCVVNLEDIAVIAQDWLGETTLGGVTYY